MMGTTRRGSRSAKVLAALGLLLTGSLLAAAEAVAEGKSDEAALRKRLLELNDLTGARPMAGRLKEMIDDPAATKKLLAVAVKLAKEKPQPLNRNATYLLALAADDLKEVDTSAAFYRLNAMQALRLYSERGLTQAYVGLITMYANN